MKKKNNMKKGWEVILLKDVCQVFSDGDWIETKDQSSEGIRLVQTGNIGFGFFKDKEDKSRYISEETFNRLKCSEILPGDLLVSRLPDPVGKSCIIPDIKVKMITGVDCTIIRPKEILASEFLRYYQMSNQYLKDVESGVSGATRQRISRKNLGLIPIPLPPLPEQQRIVSILDEAFATIAVAKANAEQNLKNAIELFESYLQGVFENGNIGWKEKWLGEVFDIGSSKRIMEKDWTVDGVPFYGGKEIVKLAKYGFVVSNSYISEEKYNEYASKYDMPRHGDILITARGTIGIGYIVKKGDKFYYKDGNIISMRAKIPTNPEFILYALKSNGIYDQLRKLTGATVSHLPIEKAKRLVLMMPNFSDQNTVVEKIQEIEAETKHLESIYQQKSLDLEELKKSVLQKAFNGEL